MCVKLRQGEEGIYTIWLVRLCVITVVIRRSNNEWLREREGWGWGVSGDRLRKKGIYTIWLVRLCYNCGDTSLREREREREREGGGGGIGMGVASREPTTKMYPKNNLVHRLPMILLACGAREVGLERVRERGNGEIQIEQKDNKQTNNQKNPKKLQSN